MSDSEGVEEDDGRLLPSTEVVMVIRNQKTQQDELFRILLDTGTNRCMGTKEAVRRAGLYIKQGRTHKYRTAAGTFTTTHFARIRAHKLLELNSRRILQSLRVQVTEGQLGVYDFIFGRDYMSRYGIDLMFSEGIIKWDGMQMAMKGQLSGQHLELDDSQTWIEEQWNETFAQQILDSKYEKQDLFQVPQNQIHLPMKQRQALHTLLEKYSDLFQGQLGEWPKMEVTVELTKDAVPFHCGRPIRIPHIHFETLKKEAQRLVDIGVLKVVDGTKAGPWCAPSFIVPKKDGRVRFITDYCELNKSIRRKPWPMPHITDLIQDIGAYTYVAAIDLNMGYYHLRLSDELSDMSTFILPFGLFKYR